MLNRISASLILAAYGSVAIWSMVKIDWTLFLSDCIALITAYTIWRLWQ